jgi:hypothetical protein
MRRRWLDPGEAIKMLRANGSIRTLAAQTGLPEGPIEDMERARLSGETRGSPPGGRGVSKSRP